MESEKSKMQKNEREKQMLYEWGTHNGSEDIFIQIDPFKKSYFQQRTSDTYIKEYSFNTILEFMEELNILWKNDEKMESIKKVAGVAAMKNKPAKMQKEKEQIKDHVKQEEKLPVFIYNF